MENSYTEKGVCSVRSNAIEWTKTWQLWKLNCDWRNHFIRTPKVHEPTDHNDTQCAKILIKNVKQLILSWCIEPFFDRFRWNKMAKLEYRYRAQTLNDMWNMPTNGHTVHNNNRRHIAFMYFKYGSARIYFKYTVIYDFLSNKSTVRKHCKIMIP